MSPRTQAKLRQCAETQTGEVLNYYCNYHHFFCDSVSWLCLGWTRKEGVRELRGHRQFCPRALEGRPRLDEGDFTLDKLPFLKAKFEFSE